MSRLMAGSVHAKESSVSVGMKTMRPNMRNEELESTSLGLGPMYLTY